MLFSSLIFLYGFLPLLLLLVFLVPSRFQNLLLLVASLLFYAWGELGHTIILLASCVFNYFMGLWIARSSSRHLAERFGKWPIRLGVSLNLLVLIFFKYLGFLTENLNQLLGFWDLLTFASPELQLPIGISFFTFQAISYLVDVHQNRVDAQKNWINLGLYIALFPQLIAGPIVRYCEIATQIKKRSLSYAGLSMGIERFLFGLSKKVLLANNFALLADEIFAVPPAYLDPLTAWVGLLCYALQIYFDFSGYSDMAIGLGRMLGFTIPENFNFPYIATSIREFWRRWHISLSNWFRDYLYIPLGGNRKGSKRTYFNLFVVFFLTGLWHGASWNFIIWGLLHGFFMIIERLGVEQLLQKVPRFIRHLYVLLIVLLAWVFFRATGLNQAIEYIKILFALNGTPKMAFDLQYYLNYELLFWALIGLLACTPMLKNTWDRWSSSKNIILQLTQVILLIGCFLYCSMQLAVSDYNPFIYFQF